MYWTKKTELGKLLRLFKNPIKMDRSFTREDVLIANKDI
jgi:hypothetical protein